MAQQPRPDGPWVDGVSDVLAVDMNRLEANDADADTRLVVVEARMNPIAAAIIFGG